MLFQAIFFWNSLKSYLLFSSCLGSGLKMFHEPAPLSLPASRISVGISQTEKSHPRTQTEQSINKFPLVTHSTPARLPNRATLPYRPLISFSPLASLPQSPLTHLTSDELFNIFRDPGRPSPGDWSGVGSWVREGQGKQ